MILWYFHASGLLIDINTQPDSVYHQTVEIFSQNPSDILSCPHNSPECAKHPGPVCQTLSTNALSNLSTPLQLTRGNLLWLVWSNAKIKPDSWFFGCRHANINHWKIWGQPQCTQWLWLAAVSPNTVVCHESPLLRCPAADLHCRVFILPNPACPGTKPPWLISSCFCSSSIATGQFHYCLERASYDTIVEAKANGRPVRAWIFLRGAVLPKGQIFPFLRTRILLLF